MLQTLLYITDHHNQPDANAVSNYPEKPNTQPDLMLSALGYRMLYYSNKSDVSKLLEHAEGVLLKVNSGSLNEWVTTLRSMCDLPFIWWNEEPYFSISSCDINEELDGMLYPELTSIQVHWSLFISVKHYRQRTAWKKERSQLLGRLEERKWIDQAK